MFPLASRASSLQHHNAHPIGFPNAIKCCRCDKVKRADGSLENGGKLEVDLLALGRSQLGQIWLAKDDAVHKLHDVELRTHDVSIVAIVVNLWHGEVAAAQPLQQHKLPLDLMGLG